MKTRFTNYKSHTKFKYNKRLCELSKHFADNLILHALGKYPQLKYDNSLQEQIRAIITEKVDVSKVGPDMITVSKNNESKRNTLLTQKI